MLYNSNNFAVRLCFFLGRIQHNQKCQVGSVTGEIICFSSHHSQECQVDGVAGDLICVQFYFAICYLVFRTNRLFFVKKEPITLLLFLEK